MNNEKEIYLKVSKYNILHWIKSHAIDSKPANDAFDKIQTENPRFSPDPHPGLIHYSGEARLIKHESPISKEEFYKKPIDEIIDKLYDYNKKFSFSGPDREGLLQTFNLAVKDDFKWSLSLGNEMLKRETQLDDIWNYFFKGWSEIELDESKWNKIIEFLNLNQKLHNSSIYITTIFENGLKNEATISLNILPKILACTDSIWNNLTSEKDINLYQNSWLTTAINESSGRIVEFWVLAIAFLRQKTPNEDWYGMPEDFEERFLKVFKCNSFKAQLSTTMLLSRLDYFYFYIDKEWTEKNLLPVLNWDLYPDNAESAWGGFLMQAKTPLPLVDKFKKLFLNAIDKLPNDSEKIRDRLFLYCIGLINGDENYAYEKDKWFYEVVKHNNTSEQEIVHMIDSLGDTLHDDNEEVIISIWNRWLKDFWKDRINNIPKPFTNEESDKFLELIPYLEPVLEDVLEVVELIDKSKISLYQTSLFWQIKQKEIWERKPETLLDILNHILNNDQEETLHVYDLKEIADAYFAIEEALPKEKFTLFKENLTRLGVI